MEKFDNVCYSIAIGAGTITAVAASSAITIACIRIIATLLRGY